MRYTEIKFGKAPSPRIPPVRRLTIEKFHPRVSEASGKLFAAGHFSRAVTEAFMSLEVRVRGLLGTENSGTKLMDDAFAGKEPELNISAHEGRSGQDEQAGFHAIFRGAMLGIRNPSAHELAVDQDRQEALEYLALASLLHRRLDNSLRRRLVPSPLQNVVGTGVAVDRLILADFSCRAPGWKIEQLSWLSLLARNSGLPRTVLVKLGVPLGSKRVVKFAPQLGRGGRTYLGLAPTPAGQHGQAAGS